MHLLEVKQLGVQFQTPDGVVSAVNGINFTLNRGETLGIVGESGSGKSQSMLAMMGLLAINGKATGQVLYQGQDLISMPTKDLNRIRGNRVAMIFQDPMTSLNPSAASGCPPSTTATGHQPSVSVLAVAAFVIVTTEFLLVGLLPALARDLAVSVSTAGQLVTLFAVIVMLCGPPLTDTSVVPLNVPAPLLKRTLTVASLELAASRSRSPSASRSPTAMPFGKVPTTTSVVPENVLVRGCF